VIISGLRLAAMYLKESRKGPLIRTKNGNYLGDSLRKINNLAQFSKESLHALTVWTLPKVGQLDRSIGRASCNGATLR
jgi:hypothetical protein